MTPQQTENIKIGAAVLATGLVLYLLVGNKTNANGTPDPAVTGNPAISFNPRNVSESLYDAMSGFGTDETAVLEILKTVSPGQFMQVAASFGLKPYNSWLGNDMGFGLDSLPLKTWLKNELSSSDFLILKNKYTNQL